MFSSLPEFLIVETDSWTFGPSILSAWEDEVKTVVGRLEMGKEKRGPRAVPVVGVVGRGSFF